MVELMIVVAIIGILSAIAIPAYQNYIRKSEVTVGISTAESALTTNIDLFIQETGAFPSSDEITSTGATPTMSSLGTLSLAPDGQNATQGTLTFEFNTSSSLAGKKVQWTKMASDWRCVQDALDTIKSCPKTTEGKNNEFFVTQIAQVRRIVIR
ncbi:pilin [Vibrio sp. PP-XX7]